MQINYFYQFPCRYAGASNVFDGLPGVVQVSAGDDDPRTPLGHFLGQLLADAGIGAGHDAHQSIEAPLGLAVAPVPLAQFAHHEKTQQAGGRRSRADCSRHSHCLDTKR